MRAIHSRWPAFFALIAVAGLTVARAESRGDEPAKIEFFEKRIRPILVANCYNCHSANTNAKGGLRVDDRQGLVVGGGRGAAIVPGDPDASLLIKAVRQENKGLKMPAEAEKLSPEQIADLVQWIKEGAAWPKVELPAEIGKSNADYEHLRKTHWAWQPLATAQPPEVAGASWVKGDIDRFILAGLEAKGLAPVADADKVALVRRVTFDLTGLPPTPEEIDAFVADQSPEAFAKVVDRLLASPAFGERWGRHWLDVARYGESTGSARNIPYPHAWRYRDWVIAAFNADKPYHEFLREQIAGDLLPANSARQKAEQLVATGFLALGVKDVNQRFKVRFLMDNVDEQIDTVSRAVLGLTVSCARCHDHKFDPIPTTDYYALAGIFRSTDLCAGVRNKMGGGGMDYYDSAMLLDVGLDSQASKASAEKIAAAKAAFEKAQAEFQAIAGTAEGKAIGEGGKPKQFAFRQRLNKAQQDLSALTDPAASGEVALGVRDAKQVSDTEIRIRGEAEKLGPVAPRGYLSVVYVPNAAPINPEQSGRLELARWLTSPANPLTSRVMANRVWQHLFGQGLVRTVDNFGVNGDSPSHPELLDHLASRLVNQGWSVKKLVRSIVLSRSYQLGGDAPATHLAVDPANRLVWRHSPRRLDAEEIRDAMLAAAGKLNLTPPQASPAKDFPVREIRNNGPEAAGLTSAAAASLHRSVYLPLVRGVTPTSLAAFDFAEQGMVTGSRDSTTVATQALYLLNDPLVRKQSLALAERLLAASDLTDAQRIELAHRLIFGRVASSQEVERGAAYLVAYERAYESDLIAATAAGPTASLPADAEAAVPKATGDAAANPDDIDRSDKAAKVEVLQPGSPKAAAWASFCQALIGSAEFRFVR